jgi:peptidoglycan/LPS O-acetylase OafA/YrhL
MMLSIVNVVWSTNIFIAIFAVALFLSWKRRSNQELFPADLTQELKGLAILAIVFSHIGYFLVADHRFLFPLSIMAGVGLNLFLFLSGYGLVASALAKPRTIIQYYWQRLPRLYLPFWLAIIFFVVLDYFFLARTYELGVLVKAVLGWFPRADLFTNLNSPLWYFSLILFYYLIFPLVFIKKAPWLSALLVYLATWWIIDSEPKWLIDVQHLYEVHLWAFPLGMTVAWLLTTQKIWTKLVGVLKNSRAVIYYPVLALLLGFISYSAYYSGVGQGVKIEERTSLLTMTAIILLFMIKKVEFRLLSLFGLLSYEIYLLHWPILSRYPFLFTYLPAWLAVVVYLMIFLGLAWCLQVLSTWLNDRLKK